jgi:hypothetical protein
MSRARVGTPLMAKQLRGDQVTGIAVQFTFTNAREARFDRRWMARATSSLPVPVSPLMRTDELLGATLEMRESPACKAGEAPTISSNIEVLSISSRRTMFSR